MKPSNKKKWITNSFLNISGLLHSANQLIFLTNKFQIKIMNIRIFPYGFTFLMKWNKINCTPLNKNKTWKIKWTARHIQIQIIRFELILCWWNFLPVHYPIGPFYQYQRQNGYSQSNSYSNRGSYSGVSRSYGYINRFGISSYSYIYLVVSSGLEFL